MKSYRPMTTLWPVRVCCFLSFFCIVIGTGCRLLRNTHGEITSTAFASDTSQAQALEFYKKGILLENSNGDKPVMPTKTALAAFRQAYQLAPTNSLITETLLRNLVYNEQFAEALKVLEAYLHRHPEDTVYRRNAIYMAIAAERHVDAVGHCRLFLDQQPEDHDISNLLIGLYFQLNQTRQALAVIRAQQIFIKPSDPGLLPVLWAMHLGKDRRSAKQTIACINLALPYRTNALKRAALLGLKAEMQIGLAQTNAAQCTLQEAVRLNPNEIFNVIRLGALLSEKPSITNQLVRLTLKERDLFSSLLTLAATRQALGYKYEALATLTEAYELRMRSGYFPSEGFYLWMASLLEETQASHHLVESRLREALSSYPDSHEIRNFLAYRWTEAGIRLDEANELINKALTFQPENAAYLDTKGWLLFKQGRFYDALQYLLKAAEIDANEPVILDHVGDALKAIGREGEALTFWKQSQQIKPQPAIAEKLLKNGATTAP